MNKPKRRVRWESSSYYDLGIVHFGRVSIPLFVVMISYLVVMAVLFFGGVALGSITGIWFVGEIAIYMFFLAILVAAVVGVGALAKWLWSHVEIEGPGN